MFDLAWCETVALYRGGFNAKTRRHEDAKKKRDRVEALNFFLFFFAPSRLRVFVFFRFRSRHGPEARVTMNRIAPEAR
jgi:hypothetical protein